MADKSSISVLFVCLGNICRSPMAEAVFLDTVKSRPSSATPQIGHVDSAGTGGYHIGAAPDSRTMAVLKKNGITSYTGSARKVEPEDFETFDYLLAMDAENLEDLQDMRQSLVQRKKKSEGQLGEVMLFGAFGGKSKKEEVVDPYYGAKNGFDVAFEQMQRFSKGFLEALEGKGKAS